MPGHSYSGVGLTYLPPVMEGESIVGYLYRCMYAGRYVRMKDLATTLVQRLTIQPPWTLASHLRRLADQLRPVLSSGEHILHGHTCLPAHLPFVTAANLPRVLAHVLDGSPHRGLAAAIGLTGNFIETKPRLAICLPCVREDELKFGFAYWHREHALAGVTFCAKHGRPLVVGCGRCRLSQIGSREPLLPGRKCWCQGDLVSIYPEVSKDDSQVLTRISGYASELLAGALEGRNAEDVGTYLQHCAQQAGFSAGARIRSPMLTNAIEKRYSTTVLATLNARLGPRWKWANFMFGRGVASSVLGRNLLLFDFFGQRLPTANDFLCSCENRLRMRTQRTNRPSSATSETAAEIMADRRAIESYVRTYPQVSRTVALKALGRTVVRARERDSEWYETAIPAKPRGGRSRTEAEKASYLEKLDESACTHVMRRREELLASPGQYPKAITRTALLKGLPRGNELGERFLVSLPKTAAALHASIERREQFQVRFAMTILRRENGKTLEERLWEAYRRTGLSPTVLEALNFSLVKELPWHSPHRNNGC